MITSEYTLIGCVLHRRCLINRVQSGARRFQRILGRRRRGRTM